MKSRISSAILIILFVTACNGTIDVGIEHSPTNIFSLITTSPIAPTQADTLLPPEATDPQPSPIIPVPIETMIPTDFPTQGMVKIFLIAVDDDGKTGTPVGCGDSVVPVQVEIPPTQGVLKAALVALLSVKDQYYGQSGLYNALYQSDLQVESLSINGSKASVYLTGTVLMGGECDSPRVQAQLEQTVLQFQNVTEVAIFINGKPLVDILSLKG
jgi:hypothetical protein